MKLQIGAELADRIQAERRCAGADTPAQRRVYPPTDRCRERGCAFPSVVRGGYCRQHGVLHEGDASTLLVSPVFAREWAWIEALQPKHAEQP